MADACATVGIKFTWEYDRTGTKHDRDFTTDHGWKIVLSRGLDALQRCELNDAFSFTTRLQQQRPCKEFNVTFVRVDQTLWSTPRINPSCHRHLRGTKGSGMASGRAPCGG